ncbi:MAG: phosphoglucosamine mutase [Acidimicrobiales bacterium]
MRARFGTDGVRGVANSELTPELVLALGRATARVIPAAAFLVGRDTRRSGPLLQAALSAGLAAEGADVIDVGVLPTPALAWLAAERSLPAAVISASHNPFPDNGVKLFSDQGTKLPVATEEEIEVVCSGILDPSGPKVRAPEAYGVGRMTAEPAAAAAYADHLVEVLDGRRLDGLSVVVDCANGAASGLAESIFTRLGADVTVIGAEPDGTNINDGCGSTAPDALAAAVVARGAALGLALDGDADRLLAVDGTGALVGGDELLALFAQDLASRGQLAGNTVVVTVMTNLGFRRAMTEQGIVVKETPVGDRHVLARLDADGLALGGEQSGHIIFRQAATTGDGMLTGLALADLVVRSGRPLADLATTVLERVPQVLVNVQVAAAERLADAVAVWEAVAAEEEALGATGRILLRPSGTEPLVRVMVEASGDGVAEAVALRLAQVVRTELGAAPAPG